MSCTLKRCQGKRGCICPKGKIPVGCYSNSSNNNAEKAPTKLPPINNKAAAAIPTRKPIVTKKALSIINKKPVLGAKAEPKPEPKPVEEEEEEEEPEILNCDGKVIIRYNHYKKEFVIVKGSCTAIAIDEQYALSYAYPNSKIHISKLSPSDFSWEDEGLPAPPIEREKPVGVYRGLVAGEAYWVHIEEDKKELAAYEERQAELAKVNAIKRAEEEKAEEMGVVLGKTESCSCIEGNPCVDKYCCKDWNNRYEVAKKNGWKGFQ